MIAEMNPLSRHRRLIFVALLGVSALLALARFDSFQVGTYSDDAHYIVLAGRVGKEELYALLGTYDLFQYCWQLSL
ncbi:MAG: hypothetical protein NZ765_10125 [Anaerolineae bacterium]|nr:hypothetical protein [Anaerolineae bacterium]MDW8071982.1 hypothetical protein [Anaerolineae bacterium]